MTFGNDGLLAVVADHEGRDTAKIPQGIVVIGSDPLRLFGGDHALRLMESFKDLAPFMENCGYCNYGRK